MYKCTKCGHSYPSWESNCHRCGSQVVDEVKLKKEQVPTYEKTVRSYPNHDLAERLEKNRKKEKKIAAAISAVILTITLVVVGGIATGRLNVNRQSLGELDLEEEITNVYAEQGSVNENEASNVQLNDLQRKLYDRGDTVEEHVDAVGLIKLLEIHFSKPIQQITWKDIDQIKGLELKTEYADEWTLGYPNNSLVLTTLEGEEKIDKVYPVSGETLSEMAQFGDFAFFHGLEAIKVQNRRDFPFINLKSMKDLKTLSISSVIGRDEFGTDQDIQTLGELAGVESIEELSIEGDGITSLSGGEKFTNLHTLEMKDTDIQDFSVLAQLPNLKHLHIENNEYMIPIEEIAKLTQLESLNLAGENVLDLSSLKSLVNLKELTLEDTKLRDINFIQELQLIEHLELRNNYELTNVDVIASLPNLKELMIGGAEFSMPVIKSLTYLGVGGLMDAMPLAYMPNLEKLEIQGGSISNGEHIGELTKLKEITLIGGYISSDTAILFNHPSLEKITIKDGVCVLEDKQKPRGSKIKELSLSDTQFVYDFQIQSDGGITQMDYEEYLADDVVEYLSGLDQLESLTIRHMGLRNLTPIMQMKALRVFNSSENEIADVSPLKNHPKLEAMDLSGNLVTDLSPLLEIPTLEKIRLSGLAFSTEDELNKLREKCVVVSE